MLKTFLKLNLLLALNTKPGYIAFSTYSPSTEIGMALYYAYEVAQNNVSDISLLVYVNICSHFSGNTLKFFRLFLKPKKSCVGIAGWIEKTSSRRSCGKASITGG